MDWLKKFYEQVVEQFQATSPTTRLTVGLIAAAAIVGLGMAWQIHGVGSDEFLFGARPFTDHELSIMEAALAEAGLQDWTRESNRLRVPRNEKARYLAALSAAGALPEEPGAAYEHVFSSSSLLDSRPVTDSKLRRASEKSLASTIRSLRGVYSATVKIEEIDRGGFPRRKELRAVATVRAEANRGLQSQQVVSIRDIVAHGGGVASENVVVVDVNANRSYRAGSLGGPVMDSSGDPYLARQLAYEQAARQRIENVLSMYPGAIISVHAELAPADAGGRFAYRPSEGTPETSSSSQAGTRATDQTSQDNSANVTHPIAAEKFDRSASRGHAAGAYLSLVVPRATASILLPRSLFRQIWLRENMPEGARSTRGPDKRQLAEIEARVIEDVRDAVAPLLPARPGDEPSSLVTVRAFTPPGTPSDGAETAGHLVVAWLVENGNTIGLIGLAAFALWLIRGLMLSIVRKPAASNPSDRQPAADGTAIAGLHDRSGNPSEPPGRDAAADLPTLAAGDEPDLRRELSALIHDDPERAANLMADWLEDAA